MVVGCGYRSLKAFARRCVGAGDDVELPPCFHGSSNLCCGILCVSQSLVVQMTALLGQQLVLDLDGGGTSVLKGSNGVHHVQRLAEPGIATHDDGKTRSAHNLTPTTPHLIHPTHT